MRFIYIQPIINIVLFSIFSIIFWGVSMSFLHQRKKLVTVCNIVMFVISVVIILYLTLFRHSKETATVSLIPFISFVNAKIQPELYRSMLMNSFLFLPFGMMMPFVFFKRFRDKVLLTFAAAFIFSFIIELIQLIFRLGCFEVDDIIMNTVGAAVGTISYIIYKLLYKQVEKLIKKYDIKLKIFSK